MARNQRTSQERNIGGATDDAHTRLPMISRVVEECGVAVNVSRAVAVPHVGFVDVPPS